jgi:ABC-type multidrug transport system ATPase subunit
VSQAACRKRFDVLRRNRLIRTRGLTKIYGDFTAVDHIDLQIPQGEIYGFLGPNGAGKTSTILMLLGIVGPTEGEIFLFDEKYTSSRLDLRTRIGVVPEKHPQGMWKWMTAREYLAFFGRLFKVKDLQNRITYLLKQVELIQVEQKRISSFSRGMLQKLSISRALLHDPDMLILDEPHSGLDPIGIKKVRDLILSENREGRTIFISSHLLSEMEKICHRVAIIFRGRLIAEDTIENLMSKLKKEKEIIVELEHLPPQITDEVKKLEFVHGTSAQGNVLSVYVSPQGDFRKELSKFLISKDLVPVKIEETSVSLEDAFTAITMENVEMLAGIKGCVHQGGVHQGGVQ